MVIGNNKQFTLPRYIWNHKVHEQWGNEDLSFVKLRFHPTYNREAILRSIKEVMYEYHVGSYVLYEMTGEYDILLRLWLNRSFRAHAFEKSLIQRLSRQHLQVTDVFHVTRIVKHWVWNSSAEELRSPNQTVLDKELSAYEVEMINTRQLNATEFERYCKDNLIAPCMPGTGIKFVITIPKSEISTPPDARERLIDEIGEILRDETGVSEVSVYAGHGFAQLLIMGRIQPKMFDQSLSRIIMQINGLGLREFLLVRTYTHVCLNTSGQKLSYQDILLLPEQTIEPYQGDIDQILSQEESACLEVKGSAFIELNKWIFTGELERSNKITREGVLKAVVGFLNANGGTVVVGALEEKRYKDDKAVEKLKDFPRSGDYIIIGLDHDYDKGNWDKFQRKLETALNRWIEPAPISWVKVVKKQLLEKDMCVIYVNKPTRGWFYLLAEDDSKVFYVRQGNHTEPLSGTDSDNYKKDNPR